MIPREVPRWPGPKNTWDAWLFSTTLGGEVLITSATGGLDYWIDNLWVIQQSGSASGSTAFLCYFHNTAVGGDPQRYFWGGVVSPTTGVAFNFRGPFRILPGSSLFFENDGGNFYVYGQGFITSTANET